MTQTSNECDVQEASAVGARLLPEGPHVALEEARALLAHLTSAPHLMGALVDSALRRLSDEHAQSVILNWLCRCQPETWAVVAEQMTQLLVQRHGDALGMLEEAEALQRDADVMRGNGLSTKRAIEVAALTVLRAVPPMLTARLLGAQLQHVAEAE